MSETIEATGTALALLGERALVPTEVFKPGGVRVILDQIKASVAGEKIDVSTPAGREHCRSLARKIASSKAALDEMGLKLTEQWRDQTKLVNADRKLAEKELDALRDRVRAPLTEYESREKKRVEAHEWALTRLTELGTFVDERGTSCGPATVAEIDEWLVEANTLVTTRVWEEFQQRASEMFAAVSDGLNDLRVQMIRVQAEKAEAERLQAEREEEARLQAVREQEAREERLKAEAAQRARQQAEEAAAAQIARAAREAERDRQAAAHKYAAELAAQDKRAQAAHQAELARVQAEERAKAQKELDAKIAAETEAAKKREANKAHHAQVHRAARDAILKAMSEVHSGTADEAKAISTAVVVAIAKGDVPHAKLVY